MVRFDLPPEDQPSSAQHDYPLPILEETTAVQVLQSALKRKPNRAEPFTPQDAKEASSSGKPFFPFASQPEARLGGAYFTMSLAGLARLWQNEEMPDFINSLQNLLKLGGGDTTKEHEKDALKSVSQAVQQLNISFGDMPAPCVSKDGLPMTEVLSYVTKEDMMAASVNPALMTHHATTTMPCVQLHVGTNEQGTGPAVVRSACLDTGCNLNLISRRAMESDIHLFGDDVTLHKIKPFTIQFADGRSTTDSHYAIEKAQVVLGTCSYEVNFIVMENLTTD